MDTGTRNTSPIGWTPKRRGPMALRWSDPRLRNRALLAVLIVLGLAVAYLVVFRLPWWQVSEVAVEGNRFVDEEAIVRACGVRTGVPMQSIDVDSVIMRAEAVQWISTADVDRSLMGRFTIRVTEREPVGLIWDEGFILVDGEGRLRPLGEHTPPDLPLVTGLPSTGAAGEPSAALARAARMLAQVSSLDPLRSTVSELAVRDSATVVLLLSPNGTPVWLPPNPSRSDLVMVASLVRHHPDVLLRARYLDARFSGRIAAGGLGRAARSS